MLQIAWLLPLLAGCEADPAKGGFLSGVYNLSTGGYRERVTEREQSLDQARLEQDALAGERARVEREHAEVSRELAAAENRVEMLERRLAVLKQQLRSERAVYAGEQEDLRELEARLETMRASIRRIEAADEPVETKREKIADVFHTLDDYASIVDGMTERLPPTAPEPSM